MNISRGFPVIGSLYLLVGIGLGMHMGASGDHTLAPVHAHINLLGFAVMSIFGLAYRLIPGLAEGWMPKAHFWLHQIGAIILLIGLTLLMTGKVEEATIGPVLGIFELFILAGVVLWTVNLWKRTA